MSIVQKKNPRRIIGTLLTGTGISINMTRNGARNYWFGTSPPGMLELARKIVEKLETF